MRKNSDPSLSAFRCLMAQRANLFRRSFEMWPNASFVVLLGAGLGGALRHGVNQIAARLLGVAFPYGTLTVNVVGCLAMGLIAEYLSLHGDFPQQVRLFLTTGILGGFTTFSTFSLDAISLWERGRWAAAAAYVAASLVLSLAGLCAGLFLIRLLPR